MDPASILGVVSAIITFIDFSWSLVTGAKELYQNPSGTIDTNAYLKVAKHLREISARLSARFPGDTDAEKYIRDITEACREESRTLLGLLEKFRVQQKKYRLFLSLKSSWQMWKASGDVKKSKERLREYQSQIMFHFILMLQDESSTFSKSLKSLENNCNFLMVEFPKQFDVLRREIIQISEEYSQFETNLTSRISALIHEMDDRSSEVRSQNIILESLTFQDIRARHEQIYLAEDDTCGWIFGRDPSTFTSSGLNSEVTDKLIIRQFEYEKGISKEHRKTTSQEFLSWLRYGQGVLHISGKAGSGKSTLMKYIASHEQTREELQLWAGEKTLIIGSFFFWNPGTALQMTLEGLYRSLLLAVLSRCPEMIKEIFPLELKKIFERYTIDGSFNQGQTCYTDDYFTIDPRHTTPAMDFEKAFQALIQKAQHAHHRFCFFIDGLDECAGDRLVHETIAQNLKTWTKGGDIKICASSRPYKEFHDVLASPEVSKIHLHLLNRFDIWTFCVHRFSGDREAKKTKRSYLDIINEIVENSSGVFLWAHLVVDIILIALRQGDPHHILKKKLAEIPKELDLLYTKLREPLAKSKIDMERSNKMLLLAIRNPTGRSLNAIVYSWLDGMDKDNLEEKSFPNTHDYCPYSEEEYTERIKNVEKKVDSLTRGFLELTPTPIPDRYKFMQPWFFRSVQFSHRTARDFFLQDKGMMEKLEESFYGYESSYPYGRIGLAEFLFGFRELSLDGSGMHKFIDWLTTLFPEHMDNETFHKFQTEIQQLRPWLLFSLQAYRHDSMFCVSYALADINLPPASEAHRPSMLLAALSRKDWVSAAELIIDDKILDHPILVDSYVSEAKDLWPLWTIAILFTAHHQFSNRDYANNDVDHISQILHEHANRSADTLRVKIDLLDDDADWSKTLILNQSVLVNVLKLAGRLERGKSTSFIQEHITGMPHEYENDVLSDACKRRVNFILRSVGWNEKLVAFDYIAHGLRS